MQDGALECENAVDAICPKGDAWSIAESIIATLSPMIMLALTVWLALRFWRQLQAHDGDAAMTTIFAGYLALVTLGIISVVAGNATATSGGAVMLSIAIPALIVIFIYTPVWLLTLLAHALTPKSPD